MSTDHIWKTQRKQLSVSFNNQVTLSFLPIFNQKSSLLVRNVGQHVGKGSFNILEHSSACSLDIFLGELSFFFWFSIRHTGSLCTLGSTQHRDDFETFQAFFFNASETALGSNMGIQDGENSDYKQALDE